MGGNIPWHGKPRWEQGQIGIHWCDSHWIRVGCMSDMVTCCLDEWLPTTEPGLQADSFYQEMFFHEYSICAPNQVLLDLQPGVSWLGMWPRIAELKPCWPAGSILIRNDQLSKLREIGIFLTKMKINFKAFNYLIIYFKFEI